ncbi:hypothetical protein [Alteromonas macleodii]|uniref:hypothetical protein n=1 Tax=Alteromonas macleodii TaxID=28108 RepID=UPI0031400DC3|tara:strand:- start:199690 stop:199992 length:303 start_codon:yes stop_codon:yes gene_type:complete
MATETYTGFIKRIALTSHEHTNELLFCVEGSDSLYKMTSTEKDRINPILALSKEGDKVEFSCKEKKGFMSKKVEYVVTKFKNLSLEETVGQAIKESVKPS